MCCAGPPPRSWEFSVACRTPTAILWVQCGVPDSNREAVTSVWRAGPQPRSCEFSVVCRTSTAILCNQYGAPDLNRDLGSLVWRAGPQPRSCEFSMACRTPTAILWVQCGVPNLNRDPVCLVWRAGPQPRSWEFSLACRTPTAILQCGVPDLNHDPVSSVWRAGPQVMCQKICQKVCAHIDLDNKHSCLHQRNLVDSILLLFDLAHCSKYCWLNFFLCKEVSLVWQPWRRLWWNVLRRFWLGPPIGLPKELSMCGATSWLLLVLSASMCAWSRLALHMLGIWCLSWKKSWRETSGMWRMKGGLLQMRRASKSWRSALQSFVLRPRFGRMECTSGKQMMCGAGPPTQKRWKNRSGKRRASWCAHAMRCSCGTTARIASLGLNCFLAGRSDAWGVYMGGITGVLHLWT